MSAINLRKAGNVSRLLGLSHGGGRRAALFRSLVVQVILLAAFLYNLTVSTDIDNRGWVLTSSQTGIDIKDLAFSYVLYTIPLTLLSAAIGLAVSMLREQLAGTTAKTIIRITLLLIIPPVAFLSLLLLSVSIARFFGDGCLLLEGVCGPVVILPYVFFYTSSVLFIFAYLYAGLDWYGRKIS